MARDPIAIVACCQSVKLLRTCRSGFPIETWPACVQAFSFLLFSSLWQQCCYIVLHCVTHVTLGFVQCSY